MKALEIKESKGTGKLIPLVVLGGVVLEGVGSSVEQLGTDAQLVLGEDRFVFRGRRGRGWLRRRRLAEGAQRVVRKDRCTRRQSVEQKNRVHMSNPYM